MCYGGTSESVGISFQQTYSVRIIDNDPSAGSPTETLLRLLLPLNGQVQSSSRYQSVVSQQLEPIRILH